LQRLLQSLQSGATRVHLRETTEPSVLTHEILNSRPYTFLDDAPLEERRTRAVQLRRGLPVEVRDLAALDREAIERVRVEARPEPRDADELADLLGSLVLFRPEARLRAFYDELVAAERAFEVQAPQGSFWALREKRRHVLALIDGARFSPDLPLPVSLSADAAPEPEAAAVHAVRGHLDVSGPVTIAELSQATGISPGLVAIAVARLESEGFAMRGRFDPDRAGDGEEICARRLLGRIHAYTQARLRREIEPVTAQDFMRFLLRWQKVAAGTQLSGRRGVVSVVEQLQGFEAAVAAWEPQLLAARIEQYHSDRLDAVCRSGEVVWGRLSLRAPGAEPLRGAALSRATPVTLALRDDLAWLLQAARGDAAPTELERGDAARVVLALRERGALFFSELLQETSLLPAQLEDALWDGVARGLVTADGFQPLRALLAPAASWKSRRPHPRRRGLRRGASAAAPSEGRWALLPRARETSDPDALAEAVAEQLLARYGVVFRDVVARETLALPWREVVWALRRLEARGLVRGGRFVSGFVGEQYALPAAVDALRAIRRTERSGELVRVSGSDPLNLVGIIVPGERVPALRTQTVTYCDGAPLGAEEASQALRQSARPLA
jgi:ATP-dependent Lhr-like helicase